MTKMISIGANFVKVLDEDYSVEVLAKCNVETISKDSVVEIVKKALIDWIKYDDIANLYKIYEFGWYIASVVEV